MSNDPIARLRAADPAENIAGGVSSDPDRSVLQEILLADTTTESTLSPGSSPTASQPWWRTPIALVAAATFVVAGVAGAVALTSGGDDPVTPGSDIAAGPLLPDDELLTSQDPAGSSMISNCVDMYSLETLPNREYAFDGTVDSVEGQQMTFTVHEWFKGGEGDNVTLDHQGLAGSLYAPEGPALEPGTRVLVAADGGFVWSCGFNQLHDPDLANDWRSAYGG